MIYEACESKLRLVARSSTPMKLGGNEMCGRVMYHGRAAHAFSTGITCRHCRTTQDYLPSAPPPKNVQCGHLISAPVDRTSASVWL